MNLNDVNTDITWIEAFQKFGFTYEPRVLNDELYSMLFLHGTQIHQKSQKMRTDFSNKINAITKLYLIYNEV